MIQANVKYRINDIASLCDVSPSTIRLWEQHGLLKPERLQSGQRAYRPEDLERARRIQHLRKVSGLNINAIKNVLDESDQSRIGATAAPHERPASSLSQVATSVPNLGARFRMARMKSGLSLRDASRKTTLASSFISTFERTSTGATIASLQAMASCYGRTVSELTGESFIQPESQSAVTHSGAERILPNLGHGIRILQLSDALNLLDCQKWILKPGAGSDGFYSHEGEELIHVLSGNFWICLDGYMEHTLMPGDSIAFSSQRPHAWKSIGESDTILFWVNTPRSF